MQRHMTEIDTFLIGDVHGRADLLQALLHELKQIAPCPYQVIFLGDLIDRGPDSKAVSAIFDAH
ncbi:MAG: metallophosphoesterase [Phyllobacterium sp.]|uniref:metallophosphoesterase n=1 Tax=Phyllobacterium sp. TaxID=1871046 RepID=UPI0030F0863E